MNDRHGNDYPDFTAEQTRALVPEGPPGQWKAALVAEVRAARLKGHHKVTVHLSKVHGVNLVRAVDWLVDRGFKAEAEYGHQRDPMHAVIVSWGA